MTINAFLEAAKALPESTWEVGSRRLNDVLWDAVFDECGNLIAYVDGEEKAEAMAAAHSAATEIGELRDLCRELFTTGAKPKTKQREQELKDRIRELVK